MTDVIIIGGGVCGCSLLWELSRYKVNALLLEKENDVACAT
ncbi:MAG: FAD-dependent oxidoreductase, partial [Spirochaetaceae bacterium]|nr:FAD-dependent oxidoreductase [Spirochaetaceae bacterium]